MTSSMLVGFSSVAVGAGVGATSTGFSTGAAGPLGLDGPAVIAGGVVTSTGF